MRFFRFRWQLIGAALATSLAACVTPQRIEAAGDVHALLIAIRDDDRAAFDAHVDRAALERDLEGRILERTETPRASEVERALGALLAHPVAKLAGHALIQPRVFRTVAEYYGYKPGTPIPNQLVIAEALRPAGDRRVCAVKNRSGPCLITFADEDGVWRLVRFDGDIGQLRLPD
jgi:hypothetical protein